MNPAEQIAALQGPKSWRPYVDVSGRYFKFARYFISFSIFFII